MSDCRSSRLKRWPSQRYEADRHEQDAEQPPSPTGLWIRARADLQRDSSERPGDATGWIKVGKAEQATRLAESRVLSRHGPQLKSVVDHPHKGQPLAIGRPGRLR